MEKIQDFTEEGLENPLQLIEKIDEQELREKVKTIHDSLIQSSDRIKQKNEKLIVKNTDTDQVWEQIRMHIDQITSLYGKQIEKIHNNFEQYKQENSQDSEEVYEGETNDVEEEGDSEEEEQQQKNKKKLGAVSDSEDDEENDEQKGLNLQDEYEEDEEDLDELNQLNNADEDEDDEEVDIDKEFTEEEEGEEGNNKNDNDEDSFEQMERFLNQAEIEDNAFEERRQKFEKGEEESVNDSEDMGSNYDFSDNEDAGDFFKKAQMKGPKLGEGDDDDEDEEGQDDGMEDDLDDDEVEHDIFDEQRENKLLQEEEEEEDNTIYNEDEITKYEKNLMKDKEWAQRGEIKGDSRPVDSLLESTLDFKNNKKETEQITQEYTNNLEDIIKQRILDEAFDDRQRVVFDQHMKENFNQISRNKSEKGLAELYEDEFKSSLGLNSMNKDDKLKQEIMQLFKETCYKLDALSNLNFTPKPLTKNAEIQASKMKLNIDEKIPINMSSSKTQQAPKEIFNERHAQFQSKEEMNHEENRTERSRKKKILRTRKKEADKKKMLKVMQYTGQSKHEYNLVKQAKEDAKKIAKNKPQQSVKFNKSGDFFKNLQNTLDNKNSGEKKPNLNNNSKKIKKAQKL